MCRSDHTSQNKKSTYRSKLNLLEDYTFNHKVEIEIGEGKEECEKILKEFFKELRKMKKQDK